MTTTELIQEIKSYCLANTDAERLQKSQRFFKEEFVGHGLAAPQLYSKVKEIQKTGSVDLSAILEAMPVLMKDGMFEEISIALLLLDGQWKQFTPETFQTIGSWFSLSITNWAHADTLAMFTLQNFRIRK
jgi:hypothetical protein